MGQVTVFVDDAVRGTLPGICVKDGVATADQLVVRDPLGDRAGLGVLWLLLLAGPLGWLGLLVVAWSRGGRGEVLTVQVPMSEPAYQRIQAIRRRRRNALLVIAASLVVALIVLASSGSAGDASEGKMVALLAAATLVGGVVTLLITDGRLRQAQIGVDLDASRRWVTLYRVHPEFVRACAAQEQRQGQRT